MNQSTWSRQINDLLRRWRSQLRIISFDYRGHGKSQAAPVRTYTIDQVANDIAHLLTVLNVDGHVVFAGHSMGGMAALTYQALHAFIATAKQRRNRALRGWHVVPTEGVEELAYLLNATRGELSTTPETDDDR